MQTTAHEVADASLAKDREQKRHLYAEHEVPEYWIANLPDRRLEVYRDPAAGDHKTKTTLRHGVGVTPRFAPEVSISAADLLPT